MKTLYFNLMLISYALWVNFITVEIVDTFQGHPLCAMWMKSNNQKSICGWQYVGWVWWGGGCSDGKSAGVTIQNISIQCSHIQSTVPVCCSIINLLFIVGTASSIKHKNKQGKKTPSDLVLVKHLLSWCCWAFQVL